MNLIKLLQIYAQVHEYILFTSYVVIFSCILRLVGHSGPYQGSSSMFLGLIVPK